MILSLTKPCALAIYDYYHRYMFVYTHLCFDVTIHEHHFWYGLRTVHHIEHSITLKRGIKQRITILSGNIICKFPSDRLTHTP